MDEIIDDDDVRQRPILYYAEIFDPKPVVRLQTVVSGEESLDGLALLVQEIHDRFRVIFGGSGKNVDFEQFGSLLQELEAVRPNFEFGHLTPLLQSCVTLFLSPHRVDQGLVQIQHQKLARTVCVKDGVLLGSGRRTDLRRIYSSEGPFKEQTE